MKFHYRSPFSAVALFVVLMLFGACSGQKGGSDANAITMYKNEGCMCCAKWATYLEDNGFEVEQIASPNMQVIKSENNVPYDMGSCHTAVVGDYVVEGHVPVEDIKNLLAEKPDAQGIAVPGMPIGSPGMERPGTPAESYKVYLFQEDGSRQVYSQH